MKAGISTVDTIKGKHLHSFLLLVTDFRRTPAVMHTYMALKSMYHEDMLGDAYYRSVHYTCEYPFKFPGALDTMRSSCSLRAALCLYFCVCMSATQYSKLRTGIKEEEESRGRSSIASIEQEFFATEDSCYFFMGRRVDSSCVLLSSRCSPRPSPCHE